MSQPDLGGRFARYNGTVYQTSIALGDTWADTLHAERVLFASNRSAHSSMVALRCANVPRLR